MTLVHILVFAALSLLIGSLLEGRSRSWVLFIAGLLAAFWLQPATTLQHFDYWLPTATIALTVLTWFVVRKKTLLTKQDATSLTAIAGLLLAISVTRIFPQPLLTPTYPPRIHSVFMVLIVIACLVVAFAVGNFRGSGLNATIFIVLSIFIVLKSESLLLAASRWLRVAMNRSPEFASRLDLTWFGFSYVAFRLLHTLRDRASNRLPDVSLREFVVYVLFFPTLTAGPIDRVERFCRDLRQSQLMTPSRFYEGGRRISYGLFKKFVLADALSVFALNDVLAGQITSTLWMWVLLYAYAFQIYLDFSAYTDLAIGIGLWSGINLPENFERPYQQVNIRDFWNRWHITLTQWFRFYFFNPITRMLRKASWRIPAWAVILVGQVATMILIGLWHGISWNFLLWGVWHGFGLFLHNRWLAVRQLYFASSNSDNTHRLVRALSTFVTFQYVALGWVWFALPNVELSYGVLRKLIGL